MEKPTHMSYKELLSQASIQTFRKAVPKKIGQPTIGLMIGGFPNGYAYAASLGMAPSDMISWTKMYPDWANKKVWLLLNMTPIKIMSRDELIEYYQRKDEEKTPFEIDEEFEEIPMVLTAAYPEDDLEMTDEYFGLDIERDGKLGESHECEGY